MLRKFLEERAHKGDTPLDIVKSFREVDRTVLDAAKARIATVLSLAGLGVTVKPSPAGASAAGPMQSDCLPREVGTAAEVGR